MTTDDFKRIQAALDWTNRQAANWLGVSLPTVKKIRSGAVPVGGPTARALRLYVAALEVDARAAGLGIGHFKAFRELREAGK